MERIEGMWAIRTRISWHKKLLDVLKRCTLAIVAPGIPYLLALSRGTGTVKEQLRFLYLYATHVWFALSPRTRKIAFVPAYSQSNAFTIASYLCWLLARTKSTKLIFQTKKEWRLWAGGVSDCTCFAVSCVLKIIVEVICIDDHRNIDEQSQRRSITVRWQSSFLLTVYLVSGDRRDCLTHLESGSMK